MFSHNYQIEVTGKGEKIGILAIGDLHIFKRTFLESPKTALGSMREFRLFMEYAQMKNVYTIFNGDLFDSDRTTKRIRENTDNYDGRSDGKLTDEDMADMDFWEHRLVPSFSKIADRCIGHIKGNHYRVYGNRESNIGHVCRKAGMKILGEHRGYINLQIRVKGKESRRVVKMFISHCSGGAPKNDIGKLKNQSESEIADIVIGGHTHSLATEIEARRTVNHFGELERKPRILIRAGNLMAAETANKDDYTDTRDYGAKPRGFAILWLTPSIIHGGNVAVKSTVELISTDAI